MWINGSTFEPPAPAEDIRAVRELTDNGLLLMQGTRSYVLFNGALFDLTSLFGGEVFAINQDGMLGGIANNQPFLRFPDGRVTTPWTQSSTPVRVIGGGGHFGGVAFEAQPEVGLGPPEALEFFGDDPLGFGGGTFFFQDPGVASPCVTDPKHAR